MSERTYLIYATDSKGTTTGAWLTVDGWTSDEYGECQRAFCDAYGNPGDKYATMVHLWERAYGIWFHAELVNSAGIGVDLFAMPGDTREQVTAAANKIRRDRDVVVLHRLPIHQLVDWTWQPNAARNAENQGD